MFAWTAVLLAALFGVTGEAPVRAEGRALDPAHSTLDVLVDKSGLFSALADNHVIRAPIADGRIIRASSLLCCIA